MICNILSIELRDCRSDVFRKINKITELPVESGWTVDLQSKKAFTLTPVLKVYYVYPIYDREIQPY